MKNPPATTEGHGSVDMFKTWCEDCIVHQQNGLVNKPGQGQFLFALLGKKRHFPLMFLLIYEVIQSIVSDLSIVNLLKQKEHTFSKNE